MIGRSSSVDPDPQMARAALSQVIGELRYAKEHEDTGIDGPGSAGLRAVLIWAANKCLVRVCHGQNSRRK